MNSKRQQQLSLAWSIITDLWSALLSLPFVFFDICACHLLPATYLRPLDAAPKTRHISQHIAIVQELVETMKSAVKKGKRVTMGKKPGSGHSSRSNLFKLDSVRLDVAQLNRIIEIDPSNKLATVEPNVAFSALVTATLQYALLPCVVPEFRTITTGGAIQGLGIESTSHIHGLFDESVIDANLLVPGESGQPRILRKSEHPDLWATSVGSNGSVSVVTQATIRLLPATHRIRLRYVRFPSIVAFIAAVLTKSKGLQEKASWIGDDVLCDGIAFGPNCVIGMFGGCVEDSEHSIKGLSTYRNHPGQPFFFEHVAKIARKKFTHQNSPFESEGEHLHEEIWSTYEYLFRYDRGGFWGVYSLASMIAPLRWALAVPIVRPFFHAFLSTTTLYKIALLLSDQHRESLVMLQDITLPVNDDCKSVNEICDWLGITPVWLCPVISSSGNQPKRMFALDGQTPGEIMLNVGLYGRPMHTKQDMKTVNTELEQQLAANGGHKALYAFYYGSEKQFWQHCNDQEYRQIRQKYGSDRIFPDLWQKVAYSRQVR